MKDIILENNDGRKFKLELNITTDDTGLETVGVTTTEIADKCNVGYEVKFLVNSSLILNSETKEPVDAFLNLFTNMKLKNTTTQSYYDTDDLALNNAGWTVRIRKKSNKKAQQCTFKKRYSNIGKKATLTQGDVNRSVTRGRREGFDTLNADFRDGCEIDYNFSKATLSYSCDIDIAETGKGATDIPDSATSITFIEANKPSLFTEDLTGIREHGSVVLKCYEGTWGDVVVGLETMEVVDALSSGTEIVSEVSFKLEDYTGVRYEGQSDLQLVNKLREELKTILRDAGFLIEANGLKTNIILERY